jgi:acetyl esterase/lipase
MVHLYPYLALLLMISACEPAMAGIGMEEAGDSLHQSVGHLAIGTASSRVWIFFPDLPRPESAHVVLFMHGWRAVDPVYYGGWIDHIAKRGSIVLYPLFEAARLDPPENSLRNAIESTKQALQHLAEAGPVKPILSNLTIVGHSLGAGLGVQMAAVAASSGLPQPTAVMAVQPGWMASKTYPTDNLARIPASTYLLIVEGDKDQFQDTRHGSTIFNAATQIPLDHKAFVRMLSTGGLIADHFAPLSPDPAYHLEEDSVAGMLVKKALKLLMGARAGEIDALDRQCLWPMFDELVSVAGNGGTIETAIKAVTVDIAVGP